MAHSLNATYEPPSVGADLPGFPVCLGSVFAPHTGGEGVAVSLGVIVTVSDCAFDPFAIAVVLGHAASLQALNSVQRATKVVRSV